MPLRVEVHADSMAVPEFNAERDARMAYIRAIAEFLTSMAPIIQTNPESAPYLLKIMQWGAAGFRVGRGIEGILDQAIAAAEKALAKPKTPQPPPIDVAAKAKQANATAILNMAKAAGQTLENKFNQANPSNLLAFDPNSGNDDEAPPTH